MFQSLKDLKATHQRTGGSDGQSPGHFFDGHTGEAETIELLRGRWVVVRHPEREHGRPEAAVLYRANSQGQIKFVDWAGHLPDLNSYLDGYEQAESK
jgi:hypothetical protein